jgi:alkylation response protein AidB-like acyl-CoA dehydrogenase
VDVFARQGFLSLLVPRQYGGQEADITSFCAITEEIARYCTSSALMIIAQAVGTMPMVLGGSPPLKEVFLTRLAKEKALVSFCLTEPGAGSDAASIRTRAIPDGDHYRLSGRKCFITNGGVASLYTVFAVTHPEKKMDGISGFVLEKGTRGLSVGKTEKKMGIRGSNTTEVILEEIRVPLEQRIGEDGGGWRLVTGTLNRSRPAVGGLAVGLAQGALDYALHYARERDHSRGTEEALAARLMLADMAIEVEAARALVYKAAAMADAKTRGAPVHMFSAMSKYFASDVAMKVTTGAVQILESQGLHRGHPVERMMRDAKVIQIFEGTNQIQRMVVANTILKSK